MHLSLITLVLGFASSVYAASVNKRAVSAAVQTCIDDLKAVNAQVSAVNDTVAACTCAEDCALAIQPLEQPLFGFVAVTINDCGAILVNLAGNQANPIFDEADCLVLDIIALLVSINDKKPQFDAVSFDTNIVKAVIKNFSTQVTALDTCLYNTAPASLKPTAQGYIDTINVAFATSYSVYGI